MVIFNTVMCTLIDALQPLKHLGYTPSYSRLQVHLLQYADDTCLVANGPSACQELLKRVEQWLQWSGMRAKVPKCYSLAIKSSTSKPFDPSLTLHGQGVPFISNCPIKFLGYRVQVPMDNQEVRISLLSMLTGLLQRVDSAPVTGKQNLLLFRAAICPRIMWDLAISHLSFTWVSTILEAEANRYIKKWVDLARSANPALLYIPKAKGGMGLPSQVTLWKKQQASRACQLISSQDPIARYAATQLTVREEKSSRVKFTPMVAARDALAVDPGMGRKKLTKVATTLIEDDDSDDRFSAMVSSEQQTGALHVVEEEVAAQWASALEHLTSSELKFALNACQDSLPHNSNLATWKGHPSGCKLCGERQSLLHVLCNCPVTIQLRQYNTIYMTRSSE